MTFRIGRERGAVLRAASLQPTKGYMDSVSFDSIERSAERHWWEVKSRVESVLQEIPSRFVFEFSEPDPVSFLILRKRRLSCLSLTGAKLSFEPGALLIRYECSSACGEIRLVPEADSVAFPKGFDVFSFAEQLALDLIE